MLKNYVGFLYLLVIHCILFVFQTKCLFSVFRDTGHNLIPNNKIGGVNSPLSKPVISKNLKEEKIVRKNMEERPRPGDVVGCWEGDNFGDFAAFQRLTLISHLVTCLNLVCMLMQHNDYCSCHCEDHVRIPFLRYIHFVSASI